MKTSSYPVKTQAPTPTPNIKRSHIGKLPNLCSCLNNYFYRANHTNKRKQKLTVTKKVWAPKEQSPKPRKINQVWVPKSLSQHSETKPSKEVTKMNWIQRSPQKKRSVLKAQVGCSKSDKKHSGVRNVPKLIFKWIPKCSC